MQQTVRAASVAILFCYAATGLADQQTIDFAHDVVPVLKKHCVACHGGKESKGGFSLNTRELVLEAEAVVPGNADKSRLWELIMSTDPEEQMPPKDRSRLTGDEAATLRAWIEQGLKWEAGLTFAEGHYEPPLKPRWPELPPVIDGRNNPLDRIIDTYLIQNSIPRPRPVSDAVFFRRAYLDLNGLLPEPRQLDQFLADATADKRQRLVHELLHNDIAYAEHWLTFWNDLLRNDYSGTGFITGGRKQITPWLYRALVDNKPFDRFVRELIAPTNQSDGFILGIRWRGDVSASQRQEVQFAQNVGQAFLGINLKCASCHDSFIDRWTLDETYGLAQIYSTEPLILHRCDKPTGKEAKAAWIFPQLGQVDATADQPTRLTQLAALMTHSENGRFTRTIVNRLWHRLMGHGIVHPVDAMHTAPWNTDLLDYLAVHLVDNGYDLKKTLQLICESQAYQSQTSRWAPSEQGSNYVFRGPLARRMTAEQFMDAVWQITGAAPFQFDAPVVRFTQANTPAPPPPAEPTARWIWSYASASGAATKPRETVTFRRHFELKTVPKRAIAAITCDNEYTLYVNGRLIQSEGTWETVELISLQSHLKNSHNEIVIVAKNGGDEPSPAGLFFELRFDPSSEPIATMGTDSSWQWTAAQPDGRGRFSNEPTDWQSAAVVDNPSVWNAQLGSQLVEPLTLAMNAPLVMVRASLLRNDAFLTSLGRPTRDQIVSMRPTELTTLEAIDLANGQTLADAIAHGANQLAVEATGKSDRPGGGSTDEVIHWIYSFALSRQPTSEELTLARELLGESRKGDSIEDFLWAVFMLPEFQLIR